MKIKSKWILGSSLFVLLLLTVLTHCFYYYYLWSGLGCVVFIKALYGLNYVLKENEISLDSDGFCLLSIGVLVAYLIVYLLGYFSNFIDFSKPVFCF